MIRHSRQVRGEVLGETRPNRVSAFLAVLASCLAFGVVLPLLLLGGIIAYWAQALETIEPGLGLP
jgi:hypothetical protein